MKILVSACLLGENCKYSGGNNYNQTVCDFVQGIFAKMLMDEGIHVLDAGELSEQ